MPHGVSSAFALLMQKSIMTSYGLQCEAPSGAVRTHGGLSAPDDVDLDELTVRIDGDYLLVLGRAGDHASFHFPLHETKLR